MARQELRLVGAQAWVVLAQPGGDIGQAGIGTQALG